MKWNKRLATGGLAAMLTTSLWAGGPVLLGGDDLTDHGSRSGTTNVNGWLYIENAIKSVSSQSTRPGAITVDIVALGAAITAPSFPSGNAGGAIGSAAERAGLTVAYYDGATNINAFFAALAAGTVNPKMIWFAGTDASNNLDSSEGAALTSNAAAINNYVVTGGGVMAHGSGSAAYGWLTTLIPGIVESSNCNTPLTFTPYGVTVFPTVTNANISSGPCHSSFSGNLGGLQIIATDSRGLNAIIGGLTGAGGIATTSDVHSITCPAPVTFGVSVNAPIVTFLPGTVNVYLSFGTLPPGMGIINSVLLGTPTRRGNYPITLTASNTDHSATAVNHCILTVQDPLPVVPVFTTACPVPVGTLNLAYSQNIVATGTSAISYSLSSGPLPTGLTLNNAGLLSGTPLLHPGVYPFNVVATNLSGTSTLACSITIGTTAPPVVIPNPSISSCPLSGVTTGSAYSQTLSATGGSGTLTYSVLSGSLPAGLTLASTGVLSGTASTAGSSSFTLQVADTGSRTGTLACAITVTNPAPAVTAPVITTACPLPNGTQSSAYSQTMVASGGTAPLSFSLSGLLPTGVTLSSAGVLSGTPTVSGHFPFTLSVADAAGRISNRACVLNIAAFVAPPTPPPTPAALSLTTTCPLPSATMLAPYSTTLASTGGTSPFTYSLTAGALPRPLTLTSGGLISGAPWHDGTYNFTLQVSDAASNTVSRSCSIQVLTVGGGAVMSVPVKSRISDEASDDVSYELSSSLPYDVYGRVTLLFNRDDQEDEAEVRFSSGGRTADFVIRAGQTKAEFIVPDLSILKGENKGEIKLIFTLADKDGNALRIENQQ